MVKVCVLLPTRGLVFTRVVLSILNEIYARPWRPQGFMISNFILSEGLGIPNSQNYLVEEGLKTDADVFLMMEEDNVLPDGALEKMLKVPSDVVCIDYPVANGYSTICRKGGKILWCGFGCTLVWRHVFEKLGKPIFRTDQTLRITDLEKMEHILEDIPSKYGGQDILFGYYANQAGFTIGQLEGFETPHLRSELMIRNENNNKLKAVYELPKVSKRQNYL